MHTPAKNKQLYQTPKREKTTTLFSGPASAAVSAEIFYFLTPEQLFGVGMHYLNDPLCFSQSGGPADDL